MNSSRTGEDEPSKPTAEDEVRAASDQFYSALDALLNGDASAMADVWSHEDDVTTMAEVGGREVGWDAIRESMEDVAAAMTGDTVTRSDQVVRVVGDAAYELCTESISATVAGESVTWENRATNIYRKENGEWKMVHEHADFDAELAEMVANTGG